MRKCKYQNERMEAQYVVRRGLLPHKMHTKEPNRLLNALGQFFRREKLHDVGISTDPDGNAIWIRKK